MKTTSRPVSKAKHGVVLSDSACPECGVAMKEKRGKLKLPVNGEEISVPDATHLSCPKCHEVVLRFDDARRLRQRALEIYRAKYGLLTADEIRSIRERYGLTQAEIARLLRLGSNTISRWETATYKPSISDLEKRARFFSVPITAFFPEPNPKSRPNALLSATADLDNADLDEVRLYALFRKSRRHAKRTR